MEAEKKQKVYTIDGAAKELGVSRTTFENVIKHKLTELPKIGRRRYFLYEEIQKVKKERADRDARYEIIA
ncbi:helix-turn-helix domain-containing protein [Elizabethkingia meningoseptica]|uniref:helix-turn-helix domain-containing protein n=1 Tax=Elizabethkingia meningoseptica TaxID=238 RepID=UPI0023B00A20|nr:helix-turn-helix domain-containing protein [Elizabethkingia meningoseptica]MDE5530480.1 helix-turn-helix domain-containing protein [Elizabethkingia meningoseptica]MDE5534037.1 helix-turn-helix domain-containing protein [Elizabethkingia meningoseptica]MDE5542687.1 helix-turn-helix domain-containing protein [Elizabethkingia meningoseptica]